jgi:hypothetical protein
MDEGIHPKKGSPTTLLLRFGGEDQLLPRPSALTNKAPNRVKVALLACGRFTKEA